jgi:hypothetical protein
MRPDRPPGLDAQDGPQAVASIPGGHHLTTTPPSAEVTSTVAAGADGDLDADLSVIHSSVDSLGPWLAIWEARTEPDAHARRCASDAIDTIDAALAALHRTRARLISETRRADDLAADRVDALLARIREGPPGHERDASSSPPPPPPQGSVTESEVRGRGGGGDRR